MRLPRPYSRALRARWLVAAFLTFPAVAAGGRPDYAHLGDEALRQHLVAIAIALVGFAALGFYGWWRYRRTYVPAPGRFTPAQALASVLAIIALVVLGAASFVSY